MNCDPTKLILLQNMGNYTKCTTSIIERRNYGIYCGLWWMLGWETKSLLSPVVRCCNRLMMGLYRSNHMLFTHNYFSLPIFLLFLSVAFCQIILLWQITIQFKWRYTAPFNHGKKYYDILSRKKILFFRKKVFYLFFATKFMIFYKKYSRLLLGIKFWFRIKTILEFIMK
jgi:hypothetical protein